MEDDPGDFYSEGKDKPETKKRKEETFFLCNFVLANRRTDRFIAKGPALKSTQMDDYHPENFLTPDRV